MWENEEHKNLVRNIIIFAVLVVVAAALLITMFAVKKRINAEDELLKAESDNQRQELNNVRKDNLDSVQVTYDADLAALQEYLPGIVCWGDSLTAGSSGSVSYPGTLQKYINTYMCDIYDLASTLDNAEGYSRVDWSQYTVSIPVVNMGSGKETSETILGRSGVEPYVLSADMEIPADTESVAIKFCSEDNKEAKPLTAGNVGFNPVTIGGVEGTITLETNTQSWGQSYYFTRSTAGDPVTVEKGTQIIPACTDAYKDYIHIVWLGTYDGVDDIGQHGSKVGDDRDQRVLQGMTEDDLHRSHALGLGGADIVLAQHIQHGGAGQTGDIGHGIEAQGDDGQQQALGALAVGGHQAQLHREDQQ